MKCLSNGVNVIEPVCQTEVYIYTCGIVTVSSLRHGPVRGFDTEYMIQVSCYVPVFVWLYVILYYLIAIELSSAKTVWFNVGSGEAAPEFGFCFIIK